MKVKPVAAVCDRRKSTALTETPQDKPVRCSGGLRPPEENEIGSHRQPLQVVAAVCDRRVENEIGSHRQPLQWAVCDRRTLLSILCLLLFFPPLFLSAAPAKNNAAPPVEPTVVYDTTVKVLRGGTCEVPLRAISPEGYDVKFEILAGPRAGSLSDPQRNSKSSVSYFYTHDGKKNSSQDSFRFKSKSGPKKAWGYAKATILVEEPPARFAADVTSLDFGVVFLGESRTLPVRITNTGGGQLRGRLKVGAPWRFSDPAEIVLAEGESKKILVTFEPLSTDTQRASLVFECATKPFPEISLQGMGESRFEAPDKAAFEQRVGANELRVPVRNRTSSPLSISVQCQPPLEALPSIKLPPESNGELVLALPARPFAEKTALVTLGDDASTRDIRIHLPPPPSRLEWELVGKNDLGEVTPGRMVLLTANLHNTGSAAARAGVRTEGDGVALAHGQLAQCDILPGEHIMVQAEWKFPEKPGAVRALLTAASEGLPSLQVAWEADVQPPAVIPQASPTPTPGPGAKPSPTPPKILTKEEQEALRKRMPGDFTYRLEPELHWTAFFPTRRSAAAIVSWSYGGPEAVEFIIEREVNERKGFFDKNPFDRTLPTPSDLPPQSLGSFWKPVEATIQKLPDARWQVIIPHLPPGYHKIRIIAKQPDSPRMDGADFSLLVGDIPLPEHLPWTLPALMALCATYLLRKKIRSLFG